MSDWFYVFEKVRRLIIPEIGTFRIYVRDRNGTVLGANGPFFSPFSPEECPTCGENVTTKIDILLDLKNGATKTKEEIENDISWEILSEKQGKLTSTWLERVVLSPPQLVQRERPQIDSAASIEEVREVRRKLNELMLSPSLAVQSTSFSSPLVHQTVKRRKVPRRGSVFENCCEIALEKLQELDETLNRSGSGREGGLYQHQVEALLSMNGAFLDGSRATVVLPTGAGKSLVVVLAPYVLKSHRTLVITPSRIISKQLDYAFTNALQFIDFFEDSDLGDYLPRTSPYWSKSSKEIEDKLKKGDELIIVNAHQIQKKRTTIRIEDLPRDRFDLIIVDEAHHYRAETWKNLIDYFQDSRILFLTATLPDPCPEGLPAACNEQMHRREYERRGILRQLEFSESKVIGDQRDCFEDIAKRVCDKIQDHDQRESSVRHQSMILALDTREAYEFKDIYNTIVRKRGEDPVTLGCRCLVSRNKATVGKDDESITLEEFRNLKFRTLVVIRKAIEGFDHSNVSVVAIMRGCRSRIVFEQFIGRACRTSLGPGMANKDVHATLFSHIYFGQRQMVETLDSMALTQDEGEDDEDIEFDDFTEGGSE